ncbi:MAG TPA: tRNA lysidine(34) synthetase TilS [bacterium]|nr:tRNA lysidine(34) synthetase TilS [bacterium]
MEHAVFLKQLAEFIADQQLKRVLVGVSGGPDSVFLLYALMSLPAGQVPVMQIAHVNHCLRGDAADADEAFVVELGQINNLPVHTVRIDISALAKQSKKGTEEVARRERYAYFARLVAEEQLDGVLVAHTLDDQAETIFMHFIRGAGVRGLAGMTSLSQFKIENLKLKIYRPLLGIRKRVIIDWLEANRIAYRIDQSNAESVYTRNVLRNQLFPLIEQINPRFVETVARTGQIATGMDVWITQSVQELRSHIQSQDDGSLLLEKSVFTSWPQALQREMIHALWQELNKSEQELRQEQVDAVIRLVTMGQTGNQIELPGYVQVEIVYNTVVFRTKATVVPALLPPSQLHMPGITVWGHYQIITEIVKSSQEDLKTHDEYEAYIDAEKAGNALSIRVWQEGDTYVPFGMQGKKKLHDLFIDAKLPRHERKQLPIVIDTAGEIIWVAGLRIADRCRVTPGTRTICHFLCRKGHE